MPYKSEKIKIEKTVNDRRIKLDIDDRNIIIRKYQQGASLRSLSREYQVDKGTIKAIISPEWYAEKQEKAKGYQKYYREHVVTKKQRSKYIREHRKYKQNLFLKGEIK